MSRELMWNGDNLTVRIYGQSHSESIGVYVQGFPNSFNVDEDKLSSFMARRAPGKNAWSTSRKEPDTVRLSYEDDGYHGVIYNTNTRPQDYEDLLRNPRPSHADYTGNLKYGSSIMGSGGGSFSGRMTAPLCIAGGMAIQYLESMGITINAHIRSIGSIQDDSYYSTSDKEAFLESLKEVGGKEFPVVNDDKGNRMKEAIQEAFSRKDSVGGVIECVVEGFPECLGGPLFNGLEGKIANIEMAIPGAKGVEFGLGFESTRIWGSENNDSFFYDETGELKLKTNNCGGILGGISAGIKNAPIVFAVGIKPTPSIGLEQDTVDTVSKKNTKITVKGRHDPCICPRAVPVVEAACAIAMMDSILCKQRE